METKKSTRCRVRNTGRKDAQWTGERVDELSVSINKEAENIKKNQWNI